MSLRFQNNELERSYAVHYRTHRARSDSMGMLFDVSLWIAAFVPNYRQHRLGPDYFLLVPSIISTCLGVAYLSRFHTNFYQRRRNVIAACWRLYALVWPTYLRVMKMEPVKITQRHPIMTAFFGSSLLINVITTIVLPLMLPYSFLMNILVSLRHLYGQYDVCYNHQQVCSSSAGIVPQFWDFLSLLNPFGLGAQLLAVTVLAPPQQCFLVFLTSEIAVLALSWSAAWCLERQSRVRYLGMMPLAELERKGGKQELFDLLLYDALGAGVRITCFILFAMSLLWACVLANHSTA